jgi:hypothetical protein
MRCEFGVAALADEDAVVASTTVEDDRFLPHQP